MKVEPATPEDVFFVAHKMRVRDFEEFSALYPCETVDELALTLAERFGTRDDILCVSHNDCPVCIGGLIELRPNVVTLLFFATDAFPKVVLPLTRFIRRELFPRYFAAGVHRVEAAALATYVPVHGWLQTLGLEPETGPLRGYGKRGEAFIQFSKVVDAAAH